MKKALIVVFLALALGFGGVLIAFVAYAPPSPDMLALNSAVMDAMQSGDGDGNGDGDGDEPFQLIRNAVAREAQRMEAAMRQRDAALRALLFVYVGAFALGVGGLILYLDRAILRPFRKMEAFASRVAQGDLSFQLEMDKENRFGAFSESFDLMREQLEAARESERLANISKKELVASLSHDVKTPVASIKIISELYQAKHGETAEMGLISGKADQIDLLISNMFTATLEELRQLKVSAAEVTAKQIEDEIRASDYQNKVRPFALPECVVMADILRFRQVVDNVIGNSYKYAGTEIEAIGGFDGGFFTLAIRDFGPGVPPDELSLLCEKFYRAGNASGKSGSGLGLYLSEYFIKEMGGSLSLESHEGFWVIIQLRL